MKNTRRSLITSTVCLLLCVSMFVGSTFAWFTDSVTSGVNQIVAGNLDIEAYHRNASFVAGTEDESLSEANSMFVGSDGEQIKWEPGAMSYENITVRNVGSLALKYNMKMNVVGYNTVVLANDKPTTNNLTEVLKVLVLEGDDILANPTRGDVAEAFANATSNGVDVMTLADFSKTGSELYPSGTPAETGVSEEEFQVLVYWEPTDSDNTWNLQNGKYASDANRTTTPAEVGELWVNFGVSIVATQLDHESDSFGNEYDANASMPNIVMPSWSGESDTKELNVEGNTVYSITSGTKTLGSVTVFEGTTLSSGETPDDADDQYKLVVVPGTAHDSVAIGSGNSETTFDVSLVNVTNNNTKVTSASTPVKVTLDVGAVDVVSFYHKDVEYKTRVNSVDGVNEVGKFYYEIDVNNDEHGTITFLTSSFSPFTTEFKFAGGLGTEKHPYLIENAGHWNKMYQAIYDKNIVNVRPYFKLNNDIDFSNAIIENYIVDNGTKYSKKYLSFVLNGSNRSVKNVSNFAGFGELFPYIENCDIKDIVINYAIDDDRDVGFAYSSKGNCYFTNVKTTGRISTTSDWASAFVIYPLNSDNNLYYTNCSNYASLETNLTSSSYCAPFGSHLNGSQIVHFNNCSNYGSISGGRAAGFVGMVGPGKVVFDGDNAVKNYGTVNYSISGGNFTCSSSDTYKATGNGTNKTCTVKTELSKIQEIKALGNLDIDTSSDVLVVNEVDGADKYLITVSIPVQVYNYDDNANKDRWSGSFPIATTVTYTKDDITGGVLNTNLSIKANVCEPNSTKYDYQKNVPVEYNGIFAPQSFDVNSANVLVGNKNADKLLLVEHQDKVFYYANIDKWRGLVPDGHTNIDVSFSVTAYDGTGGILATSSSYYKYSIDISDARSFFN